MTRWRPKRSVGLSLGLVVLLALGAWMAGRQIRSPAQVAAETAAPTPSAITVPVGEQVLSSQVVVRGTVRYGAPQNIVLANSEVKQSAGASDVITSRPRKGQRVGDGTVLMSVAGRPVFVLRGAQPSHRDLRPGSRGPDVLQLERALVRFGFSPGAVDGRYDGDTGAAVAAWYEDEGWEPYGPTDFQLDRLRAANQTAATARDLHIQAKLAVQTAASGVTKGEIAQARIDVSNTRESAETVAHNLTNARINAETARRVARGNTGVALAQQNARRDNRLALADVGLKRANLNKAQDNLADAQRSLAIAPPGIPPAALAALQAAVRAAADDVAVAQLDVRASMRAAEAVRAQGEDLVAIARAAKARAVGAARLAAAKVDRIEQQLISRRRKADLTAQKLRVLETPGDTTIQQELSASTAREAAETEADAARLASRIGIQVPANEVMFFPTLPLRVDTLIAKVGDPASGKVMIVSGSRLAIDSSLSLNDAKLVRRGAEVTIEEPDLGVKASGVVTEVADRPGTHKVDPSRVYLEVTPGASTPVQVVGASVKLTISVKSTKGEVLAVPVTALSVGADGTSRVQRKLPGQPAEYVTVEPGLAANGLVEVRPVNGRLVANDLVVVGSRGRRAAASGLGP